MKSFFIFILIILFSLIYSLFNPIKEGFDEADSYAQYKRKFDNSTTCSKHKMYQGYTSSDTVDKITKEQDEMIEDLQQLNYNNLDDLENLSTLELRNAYIREFGYNALWQPKYYDSNYINDNNYRVKYDVPCPASVCGKPDNQCAEDCRAPKVYDNNSSNNSDYLREKEGN